MRRGLKKSQPEGWRLRYEAVVINGLSSSASL